MAKRDAFTRRRFLGSRRSRRRGRGRHALGDRAGGGACAPLRRPRRRSGTSSSRAGEPLVRPLLRLRAPGAGARLRPGAGLHAARRRGGRPRAVRARRPRAPTRPTRGVPCTSSTTAARWTASTDRQHAPATETRDRLLHGAGAAVLLQPLRQLGALRELLLLGARADLAEPLLPDVRHVGRDHDERPVGLRHLRLERLADHPRPARGRRRDAGRSTTSASTTSRVGDSDNVAVFWSRWAHDPRTTATRRLPGRPPRGRCRRSRGSSRAPRWLDEHPPADVSVGMGFQQEVITALRRSAHWQHLGVPAHLRRARRLLRPRRAAADRRLRARDPRAALGHLAVRAARRGESRSRPSTSRR